MVLRLIFVRAAVDGDDPTYDRLRVQITNQVVLHASIYLATIPCAKPFFVVFEGGVFRKPTDPRQRERPSFGSAPTSRSENTGHTAPTSWDRRMSFAQSAGSLGSGRTQKQTPSPRRWSPWRWKSEDGIASRPPEPMPLRTRIGSVGESLYGCATADVSPGAYSQHERTSPLPSLKLSQKSAAEDNEDQHPCSSASSRMRRQSEYKWFDRLRLDEGSTVTTVRHDPNFAAAAARKRSQEPGGSRKQEQSGILQTQSFAVDVEDVKGESPWREGRQEDAVGS